MSQNIYDDPEFFAGYATLDRSVKGLDGAPEWPTIQAMLPALQGKNILDLGCGYGWFCRYARDNQAASVVGLDISHKMLTQAHSMTQGNGIVYRREDLETLSLSLTPGGMLVFSAEHPIYTAPLNQGWIKDKTGQQSWPVNHYQQEGTRISNWFAEGVKKQHRKLATWINALIAAGFEIVCVDEWGPSAEQIAENPALDEEKERPMIFLLRARKPA